MSVRVNEGGLLVEKKSDLTTEAWAEAVCAFEEISRTNFKEISYLVEHIQPNKVKEIGIHSIDKKLYNSNLYIVARYVIRSKLPTRRYSRIRLNFRSDMRFS